DSPHPLSPREQMRGGFRPQAFLLASAGGLPRRSSGRSAAVSAVDICAQRRPGVSPRRSLDHAAGEHPVLERSTKAGGLPPAIRVAAVGAALQVGERSTKAVVSVKLV